MLGAMKAQKPFTLDVLTMCAGIGAAQHRHEGPCAEIDAAPADVERALPFVARR